MMEKYWFGGKSPDSETTIYVTVEDGEVVSLRLPSASVGNPSRERELEELEFYTQKWTWSQVLGWFAKYGTPCWNENGENVYEVGIET